MNMDRKTKEMKIKDPKPIDCTKCKFRCSQNVTDEERAEICKGFWRLGDYRRQKDFILMNVKSNHIKRRRPTTVDDADQQEKAVKRTNAKSFFLLDRRVCQTFFLKTLAISNGPLLKAFEHKNKFTNFFDGDDKRGRHQPVNKLSEETINNVVAHFEHFASKNSNNKCKKRIICDPEVRSLKQLYRLFKEDNESCPSYTSFKKIFNDNGFAMADHLMNRPIRKESQTDDVRVQEGGIEYILETDDTAVDTAPVVQQVLPQQQKVLIAQLQDNQENAKMLSYPVYEIQLVNFQIANNNTNQNF